MIKPQPVISIVSPVYKATDVIEEFITRVTSELNKWGVAFEIVLVDDRSPDNSWELIKKACQSNPNVRAFRLSKNFGQHYAVTAGLSMARGEWIFVMDSDLQDDPSYLKSLYDKALSDRLDIVYTKRIEREQPVAKKMTAWLYSLLFTYMSDKQYGVIYGSLVLFNRKVRNAFLSLKDRDRLYLQILRWLGYDSGFVEVQHHKRFAGKSSYTFGTMMRVAVQGWISFSNKLLYYSIYFGFTLALLAFIGTIYIIFQYLHRGYQTGWPSLFVAIIFSTGLILISVGMAGIYVGKIFEQVKDRPLYIVDEALNDDEVA